MQYEMKDLRGVCVLSWSTKKMQTNFLKYYRTRDYAATKKSLNDKRFANNWFKAGPLQSKELKVRHSSIFAILMSFSNDEYFVITGVSRQGKCS